MKTTLYLVISNDYSFMVWVQIKLCFHRPNVLNLKERLVLC